MARPRPSLASAFTADPAIIAGDTDQGSTLAALGAGVRFGADPLVAGAAHRSEGKLGPHWRDATARPAGSLRAAEDVAGVTKMATVEPPDFGRRGLAAVPARDRLGIPASVAQALTAWPPPGDLRVLATAVRTRLLVVTLVAGPAQGTAGDAETLHRVRAPAIKADETLLRSAGLAQGFATWGSGCYGVDPAAEGAFLATRRIMPDARRADQAIRGVAAADWPDAAATPAGDKSPGDIAGAADSVAVGAPAVEANLTPATRALGWDCELWVSLGKGLEKAKATCRAVRSS